MSLVVSVSRIPLTATILALALPSASAAKPPATTPTTTRPASALLVKPATRTHTTVRTATFPTPASEKVLPNTATTPKTFVPKRATPTTIVPGGEAARPFNSVAAANARARVRARPSRPVHISTEAIVLAAIAALLLLACAAWAFARSRAYEPHWLLSLRHAMAEAGFRTSATWAEFTDWARLGR